MKKLIGLLSFVLLINFTTVKAQTTNSNADVKKEATGSSTSVQCQGNSAACSPSCADKASGASTVTLTDNHANAGSTAQPQKVCTSTGKNKSCCKHGSRASAMLKTKDAKEAAVPAPQTASPQQ